MIDSPPSAPGGGWRLRREGVPAPASARAVTRVESSSPAGTGRVAKIDWLNATFDTPPMSLAGLMAFVDGCMTGATLSAKLDGGLFGFTERHRLTVHLKDGARVEVGAIALGGDTQKGRWLLQLNGRGCGLVSDWPSLQELLEGLGAAVIAGSVRRATAKRQGEADWRD
jgi:phage replication initiation protein